MPSATPEDCPERPKMTWSPLRFLEASEGLEPNLIHESQFIGLTDLNSCKQSVVFFPTRKANLFKQERWPHLDSLLLF